MLHAHYILHNAHAMHFSIAGRQRDKRNDQISSPTKTAQTTLASLVFPSIDLCLRLFQLKSGPRGGTLLQEMQVAKS